ncbi:MAG: hypothetical protein ACE149_14340 [Armatimonadota bacterium]
MSATSSRSLLYVATDLDTWETSTPEPDQDAICERCGYRRLDPEYYAWLRHRMEVAKQAHARGRLPAARYQELRRRFNTMHTWAVTHLGEAALVAAVKTLDPKAYRPPQVEEWEPTPQPEQPPTPPHLFPVDGHWRFTERVSPEALAQVDAVREQAMSLGWTEAGLYQNRGRLRFPAGGEYGLVCLLRDGATITEVAARFIEITSPRGSRLRRYNSDADQPWLHRVPTDSDTPARTPVSNG